MTSAQSSPNSHSEGTQNIDKILNKLEKVSGCKLRVTSGDRTPKENRRVNGAKNSFHLQKDRARDIKPVDPKCIKIKDLGKIACRYTSTITYPKHIHIDNRETKICFKGSYK